MFDARLSTQVWVDALLRRVQVAGASVFVLQRGDESRGDILIKVTDLKGAAQVYTPRLTMEGERVFANLEAQSIGPDEASADAYLRRAKERDRDLWVVEIEDPEMRHFLTERVE